MNIVWKGQSFFEIASDESTIAIDPFDESIGLKVPKVEADILLQTHAHPDHSNKKAILGKPFFINSPGEYEVEGIFIQGIPGFHDEKQKEPIVIYKIEAESMRLCHLSDLGQKELSEQQVDQIGEVDVLMIPVGGKYTIDAKTASSIVSQIEPRIVIPMHYKIAKLKLNIDGVDKFLKQMGEEGIKPEKKLKLSLKNLPQAETKIVVLEP